MTWHQTQAQGHPMWIMGTGLCWLTLQQEGAV